MTYVPEGGLYSRLKCDLSHFGGIIFEGGYTRGGYTLLGLYSRLYSRVIPRVPPQTSRMRRLNKGKWHDTLREYMELTTLGALPQSYFAHMIALKLIWIVVFLAGISITTFHSYKVVQVETFSI